MVPFIGLTLMYGSWALVEPKIIFSSRQKKIYLFFLTMPLFVISAFRDKSIGTDTLRYFYRFQNLSTHDLADPIAFFSYDGGYVFLQRIVDLLGGNFLTLQIMINIFIYIILYYTIYKYSYNTAFSIYIFITMHFFFDSMNITREYIAAMIILCSIESIRNRKIIKFCILITVAMTFHFSSIIFALMYPISIIKWTKNNHMKAFIICIILFVLFDPFIKIITNILGRYGDYLEGTYFVFDQNMAIYFSLVIDLIIYSIALVSKYYNNKVLREISTNRIGNTIPATINNILYSALFITVLLSIIGLNTKIMGRISLYFSILSVIYIPNILNSLNIKSNKYILTLGILMLMLANFIVIMYFRPYWTEIIPYSWWK